MGAPSSRHRSSSALETKSSNTISNANAAGRSNSKLLLSRGYTSRLLPPGSILRALTAEETEKDMRHFQAYHRAVISYRQQYYLAVNPGIIATGAAVTSTLDTSGLASPNAHTSGSPSSAFPHHLVGPSVIIPSLPVRIDPEEEKRLTLLRRKIARAECIREDLEQQYVSLRAHFVQYSQEMQKASDQIKVRQSFLQSAVKDRATTLGLMRARLQMTRDVLAALQRRSLILERMQSAGEPPAVSPLVSSSMSASATTSGTTSTTTTTSNITINPVVSEDKDQTRLDTVWSQVEDELKAQFRKVAQKSKPMIWPCTKLPPTPFDVPILLSTASKAPEKSVAYSSSSAFGSSRNSLVWLIPEVVESDVDDQGTTNLEVDIECLKKDARLLREELDQERRLNQETAQFAAQSRTRNDEWVAMICLLRQETESVLHRHNIVLESDRAQDAIREVWHYEQQQHAATQSLSQAPNNHSSNNNNNGATMARVTTSGYSDTPDLLAHQLSEVDVRVNVEGEGPGDEENYGDDEGSEGPEEEVGEDDEKESEHVSRSSKRVAVEKDGDEDDSRKKRRKG